jgi:hypothetical protein
VEFNPDLSGFNQPDPLGGPGTPELSPGFHPGGESDHSQGFLPGSSDDESEPLYTPIP